MAEKTMTAADYLRLAAEAQESERLKTAAPKARMSAAERKAAVKALPRPERIGSHWAVASILKANGEISVNTFPLQDGKPLINGRSEASYVSSVLRPLLDWLAAAPPKDREAMIKEGIAACQREDELRAKAPAAAFTRANW